MRQSDPTKESGIDWVDQKRYLEERVLALEGTLTEADRLVSKVHDLVYEERLFDEDERKAAQRTDLGASQTPSRCFGAPPMRQSDPTKVRRCDRKDCFDDATVIVREREKPHIHYPMCERHAEQSVGYGSFFEFAERIEECPE
jgi:hypothetical protein